MTHGRRFVYCALLTLVATTMSAPAAKPGKSGNSSTGSIGIHLTIHSTVRAKKISSIFYPDALIRGSSNYALCFEVMDAPKFSMYFLNPQVDAERWAPQTIGSHLIDTESRSSAETSECPMMLGFDLSSLGSPEQGTHTLMIAPE